MNGQVTALVDSEEMENGKRIYRTQYLRRDFGDTEIDRRVNNVDKELRVSRQYKPVNPGPGSFGGRKFHIQRDAMRIAKLTGHVGEEDPSDGSTFDDQDSPILRRQRKRQLDHASRASSTLSDYVQHNTKVSGLGSPLQGPQALKRPQGVTEQPKGSYQALELDYMLIRKALKALEDRVKLQEELRSGELEGTERAAKEAILEQSRQQWTDKVDRVTESGNPDEDARRMRLENSLQMVKSQMQEMEQRKAFERLRHSTGFQIATRIVMVIVGAFLLIQLFRAVTIQYNAEEQDLRRRLGPALYRDGWLEYSMLIF
ncbi:hypothetical protein TRVA0_019S01816 [Trichomonascus vanleenenianus]|uniref:uncharacterized protein n=1 Tax=Trichomonascus vanleenenianus TaxID=2268995 RepID=UPI003ECB0CF9